MTTLRPASTPPLLMMALHKWFTCEHVEVLLAEEEGDVASEQVGAGFGSAWVWRWV